MKRRSWLFLALFTLALVGCSSGRQALVFTPQELDAGVAGEPYSVSITITGNDTPVGGVSVSSGALPPGLEVTQASAGQGGAIQALIIAGTPDQKGTFDFTISVWCYGTNVSGQTGEQHYTLAIS